MFVSVSRSLLHADPADPHPAEVIGLWKLRMDGARHTLETRPQKPLWRMNVTR